MDSHSKLLEAIKGFESSLDGLMKNKFIFLREINRPVYILISVRDYVKEQYISTYVPAEISKINSDSSGNRFVGFYIWNRKHNTELWQVVSYPDEITIVKHILAGDVINVNPSVVSDELKEKYERV